MFVLVLVLFFSFFKPRQVCSGEGKENHFPFGASSHHQLATGCGLASHWTGRAEWCWAL